MPQDPKQTPMSGLRVPMVRLQHASNLNLLLSFAYEYFVYVPLQVSTGIDHWTHLIVCFPICVFPQMEKLLKNASRLLASNFGQHLKRDSPSPNFPNPHLKPKSSSQHSVFQNDLRSGCLSSPPADQKIEGPVSRIKPRSAFRQGRVLVLLFWFCRFLPGSRGNWVSGWMCLWPFPQASYQSQCVRSTAICC